MSETQTKYVIRTEGMFDSFGLGEVISEGVTLFRAGDGWQNYNVTREELNKKLADLQKRVTL